VGLSPPAAGPAPAATGAAPGWKQIYDDSQTVYYVSVGAAAQTGATIVETLTEFRIPQVIGGSQVSSIVSHMKLDCGQRQMATVDNTYYAHPMGAGTVVHSEAANDLWHTPEPGTLGALVWSTVCGG
jgi:hypothetical protein